LSLNCHFSTFAEYDKRMIDNLIKNSDQMRKFLHLFLSFFLILATVEMANGADVAKGKELFIANCASCHAKNMKDRLTGPALGGTQARWAGREALLYKWIRNSQAVIASGDSYAVKLYGEYNKSVMTAFPNLTDGDIDNILGYIDGVATGAIGGAPKAAGNSGQAAPSKESNKSWWYFSIFGVLALLALVLGRIISNLNEVTNSMDGKPTPKSTWAEFFTKRSTIAMAVFALVILGGSTVVNNGIKMGRQQGYKPEQPIKFSHATHAGLHKIECQYCHDGARRSKHSVIPAANTCMNCHKAIKKGSQHGTAELTKIFASIGYDPTADKYIENYDKLSEKEVEAIYKKWIGAEYMAAKELPSLDKAGLETVEDQWDGIKSSLTNETKKQIQGPIEWVRVHSLPDHAYFNHAQHVSIGKVACQKCHGEVEKMEVLAQYSPLSMGWCVNCHRETQVNFKDNAYYQSYERYHKELKEGKREKVTVEEIGGLECQKCHY
jgi:mono/diheme cytochrome c family protein